MEFGKLKVIEKTFNRVVTNPRGQDYEGIKFRRWISEKKVNAGDLEETLTFSDALFNSLDLKNYALAQVDLEPGVGLLVLDDQVDVEPIAKFMRQSKKQDGTVQKKGKTFYNEFLVEALKANGLISPYVEGDESTLENQYLALENVTASFSDIPAQVKGVYKIVADDSVNTDPAEAKKEAIAASTEEF